MKKITLFLLALVMSQVLGYAQKSITLEAPGTLYETEKQSFNCCPDAIRSREIALNSRLQDPSDVVPRDTILLNLFPGLSYKACVEQVYVTASETSMVQANIVGHDMASFVISTYKGKSLVRIDLPLSNAHFKIHYNHGLNRYHLIQSDLAGAVLNESPGLYPPEDESRREELRLYKEQQNRQSFKAVNEEDSVTISLMIVYTPAAAAWSLANETHINNTIALVIANANTVLDNSRTKVRLELVHAEEVAYTELNNGDDLLNLRVNGDGIMDNVHTLRDTYCADIVMLLEEISFTGGLGYTMNSVFGISSYAFSIVRVQQASNTSYTPIHEIGHNLGCHHHKEQLTSPGPGLYSYAAGWRWTGLASAEYCSVMTYTSGTYFLDGVNHQRVPYYSSPDITYQAIPVGDSSDADNARTFRQSKQVTASYRNGCCTPPAAAPTGFQAQAVSNESINISWTRGNGDAVIVLARQGVTVNATPNQGSLYVASPLFGEGSQIGFDLNFVVYIGSDTAVEVSSLNTSTNYYFAVFEYDETGFCYNLSPLTGSATTLSTPPPVAGMSSPADTSVCGGTVVHLMLTGASGNIQWQESINGIIWSDVTGGLGGQATDYYTDPLYDTLYFRAQITQPGYSAVYSDTTLIFVQSVNVGVSQNADTLTAQEEFASYQWVDCNNAFAPIPGATQQQFISVVSGWFAVVIAQPPCSDTSVCYNINTVYISETSLQQIAIYPNPAGRNFSLDFPAGDGLFRIDMLNHTGQLVYQADAVGGTHPVDGNHLNPGIYLLKITRLNTGEVLYFRVVLL